MDAMLINKVVLAGGLAAWFLVGALNHLQDWKGPRFFIASFMNMSSLDEEPAIPTPLTRRRIEGGPLPGIVLALITAAEVIIGLGFAAAAIMFAAHMERARDVALLASAGSAAMWFGFLVGGAWFAYWLKLGDLQRTHLILLGVTMLSILIFQA
jgi:predicted small integral membrane protein